MKMRFYSVLAISAILVSACSNNNGKTEPPAHDMENMNKDSTEQHAVATDDKEIKTVAVTYGNVDATAAASIKSIVDHYLHIKTALTNDNGDEAASGAKAMQEAIGKLDKSLLTAEQKAAFDKDSEELAEHAEHIAKNGDKIKHQRLHFSMLSEVVYAVAKSFGAGRPLYHEHCPMYNDNKGAMWLSDAKEVKNPYYGSEMLTCGTVEEVIQ